MIKSTFSFVVAAVMMVGVANAAMVDISWTRSRVTAEAEADGAVANGVIHDIFATSDADIISVREVAITGVDLYNVGGAFGSNTNPPPPDFLELNKALLADSWITTPGDTNLLGPDFPGDGVDTTFGDLTDDGPQTNFQIARLTIPPPGVDAGNGMFTGVVSVRGDAGPELFPFQIPLVPEPTSLALAGLSMIGLLTMRRRS